MVLFSSILTAVFFFFLVFLALFLLFSFLFLGIHLTRFLTGEEDKKVFLRELKAFSKGALLKAGIVFLLFCLAIVFFTVFP
jgi:hypothetical protein